MNKSIVFPQGTVFGREPAVIFGIVEAIVVLAALLWPEIDVKTQVAVVGVASALITALIRQSVVPNQTHVEEVQDALYKEVPQQPELITEDAAK